MEDRNTLNENQYGFRKSKGTTAIAVAYVNITNVADKKQCNIILRNVSKTFDKARHNGLRQIQTYNYQTSSQKHSDAS